MGLLALLLGARSILVTKGIATRSKKLRTGLLASLRTEQRAFLALAPHLTARRIDAVWPSVYVHACTGVRPARARVADVARCAFPWQKSDRPTSFAKFRHAGNNVRPQTKVRQPNSPREHRKMPSLESTSLWESEVPFPAMVRRPRRGLHNASRQLCHIFPPCCPSTRLSCARADQVTLYYC